MKRFTKSLFTFALLMLGMASANAEEKQVDLTFSCADYCAATWDAETSTLSWGSGGWDSAWTFMAAQGISGDISSYKTLHLKMENFSNSAEEKLTVVFKENDGSNPPSGPTQEFVATPDEDGVWELDLTKVEWTIDITKLQDLTIYGGARTDETQNGTVQVTEAYLVQEVADAEPGDDETTLELIHETDWSTRTSPYWNNHGDETTTWTIGVVDGLLTVNNSEKAGVNYDVQYFGDDGFALEAGEDYVVKVTAKSDVDGDVTVGLGNWNNSLWGGFTVTAGDELIEYSYNFSVTADQSGAHVMLQTGFMVGTVQYGKVTVYKVVKPSSGEEEEDEDPGVGVVPEGYINLINNGTLEDDDAGNFFIKIAPADGASAATITEGVGQGKSNGLKFTSASSVSNPWDSQFWIKFNEPIPAGTTYHLEFWYKASATTGLPSQQQGANCNYLNNNDTPFSVTASNKWKKVEKDLTATVDMQSLAFNLNEIKDQAVDFYFDNFLAYMEKPVEITDWDDLAEEATFYKTEEGVGGPWAVSPDEDGMISIQSGAYKWTDWDTQFFVRLPKKLASNTKYKVSFDYQASQNGSADTQGHFEPGQYKWYTFIGSPSFTTSWQNYENEGIISNDLNGVYTIAFNLSKNGAETTFNIKNFKFEVPAGTELEEAPDVPGSLTKPESATFTQAIDGFATMVPEYSMDISGNENIEAYKVEYDSEKGCVALEATTELMSARAILVKAAAGDYTDGITMKRVDNAGNGLKNGDDGNTKGDGKTWYVLANGDSGIGFYLLANGTEVPKGKGYLVIPAAEGREFIGFADDATTVKVVENLKKSGIIYNLAGQQVKNAKKGLYIIDGKKVMK